MHFRHLYRSFRREDLRDSDLWARLLDHFAAPLRRDPEKKGVNDASPTSSVRFFDRRSATGYRLTPQVSAANYRIDLVVEGHSGRRLAIECDGDQYHTPDMWLHDLNRQRNLERVGWTFWRCWGSSFLRDPDARMADLFTLFNTLGIQPIGALDIDFTDIVEYREVGGTNPAQDWGSAPDRGDLDLVPAVPVALLTMGERLVANPENSPRAFKIELRDSARFCFVDVPDNEVFVTIVDSESNPELGFINQDTPIARALLGSAIGQERIVHLPMGKRSIRVLEVFKPRSRKY